MPLYAALGDIVNPALSGQGEQGRAAGLIEALDTMARASGLPGRLRDVGVTAADLPQLAWDAMLQDRLLKNNPCPIEYRDALRLYEAAL
jgi:alcohol dehydrogenase class IV